MDLRQKKTRRSIINAFLKLRSEKPLEKITVRELTECAEIHKATFYLHFQDIYALSEILERELIEDILAGISHPENFLRDPERFHEELFCQIISHESLLHILFSDSRAGLLGTMLEEHLRNYAFSHFPKLQDDPKTLLMFTYLIQGGYHVYMQYYRTMDSTDLIRTISAVSKSIISQFIIDAETEHS